MTTVSKVAKARFIYFVQPGFDAHAHIHRYKVRCLREVGFEAEVVTVVSWRRLARERSHYRKRAHELGVRVLTVPHAAFSGWRMDLFAARHLRHQPLGAQVLRCAWPNTRWLRRVAQTHGTSFHCLLELEGDHEAEADYLLHHPYKPGFYRQALAEYRRQAPQVRRAAEDADGLVLMSREHIELWEKRLGRAIRAVAMPAMFDPNVMRFDSAAREEIRRLLGLRDHVVLVYSGNVMCSWQKFGSICRITSRMISLGVRVALLALVRGSDHPIAAEFLDRHGLRSASRLLHVPPAEMPRYLSAADLGMFIREDHLMNRIVTSAKLGEYLACGLPVITTGVGALYHDFIRLSGMGVFVRDPAAWGEEQTLETTRIAARSHDPSWRSRMSGEAHRRFAGGQGTTADYVSFVAAFCGQRSGTQISA